MKCFTSLKSSFLHVHFLQVLIKTNCVRANFERSTMSILQLNYDYANLNQDRDLSIKTDISRLTELLHFYFPVKQAAVRRSKVVERKAGRNRSQAASRTTEEESGITLSLYSAAKCKVDKLSFAIRKLTLKSKLTSIEKTKIWSLSKSEARSYKQLVNAGDILFYFLYQVNLFTGPFNNMRKYRLLFLLPSIICLPS